MDSLKRIFLVAQHEWTDALRSRKAAVMFLLYVGLALLSCHFFVELLKQVETHLSDALMISRSAQVGSTTSTLWESSMFRNIVTGLVGDESVARGLFSMSPISVFYGWMTMTFTPALVLLLTSGCVSEEVGSGSARYVLLRVPRAEWIVGKWIGQILLVLLALILSMAVYWVYARFRVSSFDALGALVDMLQLCWRAWVYSIAFVGVAVMFSQFTRWPLLAMALAYLGWMLQAVLHAVAAWRISEEGSWLWGMLQELFPQGHKLDLWRMQLEPTIHAVIFLLSISLVSMFVGYVFFQRRDVA